MTIQRVGRVALVLSLLTGSALAEEPAGAPAEAIAPVDVCVPAAEGSAWARWSLSHLGLFWDFDGRVKRAFPVGSCEKDLREWLAAEGGGNGSMSKMDDGTELIASTVDQIDSLFDVRLMSDLDRAMRRVTAGSAGV